MPQRKAFRQVLMVSLWATKSLTVVLEVMRSPSMRSAILRIASTRAARCASRFAWAFRASLAALAGQDQPSTTADAAPARTKNRIRALIVLSKDI